MDGSSRRSRANHDGAARRAPTPPPSRADGSPARVRELLAIGQAKLEVGPAGDQFEREADQVAQQVVQGLRSRAASPTASPAPTAGAGADAEMTGAVVAESDDGFAVRQIRRRAPIGAEGGAVDAGTEQAIQSARGGGQPLPAPVRASMESGFGADFSGVRVHTGSGAEALNDSMSASAFTVGNDIFFRSGLPDTSSRGGQELLAHELTHTIQQGASRTLQRQVRTSRGRAPTGAQRAGKKGDKARLLEHGSDDDSEGDIVGFEQDPPVPAAVERAVSWITTVSDDQISSVASALVAYAKQGKASGQKGPVAVSASGQVDAQASAEGNAKLSREGELFVEGVKYLFEANVLAKAGLELSGSAEATLGPLAVTLAAKLSVLAEAAASVKGELTASLFKGFTASFEAKAGIAVSATGEASVKLNVGSIVEAELSAMGEVRAALEASAAGSFSISKNKIEFAAEASGFMGVSAKGRAGAAISIRGKKVFSIEVSGEVQAGLGGKIGGSFTLERGVITLTVDLGAALGVGAAGSALITIDIEEILTAAGQQIARSMYQAANSPTAYKKLVDIDKVEQTIKKDFFAYSSRKDARQGAGKAENWIKKETLQSKIDAYVSKYAGDPMAGKMDAADLCVLVQSAADVAFGPDVVQVTVGGEGDRSVRIVSFDPKKRAPAAEPI